ncbi:hypothetical protein KP509_22G076700 [Ceratopteris richardii]|uniref:Ionotropic glutamate receptor C-terminal domain-containing protein n=1 Tax=Ceratopteris richardii TaxID=49495 RepID=A0A8T2S6L1_CERRI|nr:hypothetical protein KP509_22G076700 [Ceratopteris richardii]
MASCTSVWSLTLRIISPIFIAILFFGPPLSMATAERGPYLASRNGTLLKVLVPAKGHFNEEFIVCDNSTNPPRVDGFCKAVFIHALSVLSPKPNWTDVVYECFEIEESKATVSCTECFEIKKRKANVNCTCSCENNASGSDYTALVRQLNKRKDIDAIIGDITVGSKRFEFANFTQTYIDSGIVIVTLDDGFSRTWIGIFFEPFDHGTWIILVVSILAAGFTLWLLEDNSRMRQHSYQSATSRFIQFSRTFWFLALVLVFFRRDCIKSSLSKFVMMTWIIFILLVSASYVASLSSILTVNKRSPKNLEIQDLVNKSVGYQYGSLVKEYLMDHNIKCLFPVKNLSDYEKVLRNGTVFAVVDEIPYISLFLAEQPASKCHFSVGKKLTIEGLGFAFYNESLANAFSTSILGLSESGELQNLAKGWGLTNFECPATIQSTQLNLENSKELFYFMAGVLSLIVVFLLIKAVHEWLRKRQRRDGIGDNTDDPSARAFSRRRSSFSRVALHPSEMR